MSELADLVRLGQRALKAGDRALLAQVVRVEGSHYRRPGARMILTESGESAGSISAGCLEADLARRLPQVCEGGRPELDRLRAHTRAAAVVMTHNFLDDLSFLRHLQAAAVGYIGVLGPRERTERLLRALKREAASADFGSRLYSPVGLDIGANNAEEIALAIAAEVSAAFRGRPGRSLRERCEPIHDRTDANSEGLLAESARSK